MKFLNNTLQTAEVFIGNTYQKTFKQYRVELIELNWRFSLPKHFIAVSKQIKYNALYKN